MSICIWKFGWAPHNISFTAQDYRFPLLVLFMPLTDHCHFVLRLTSICCTRSWTIKKAARKEKTAITVELYAMNWFGTWQLWTPPHWPEINGWFGWIWMILPVSFTPRMILKCRVSLFRCVDYRFWISAAGNLLKTNRLGRGPNKRLREKMAKQNKNKRSKYLQNHDVQYLHIPPVLLSASITIFFVENPEVGFPPLPPFCCVFVAQVLLQSWHWRCPRRTSDLSLPTAESQRPTSATVRDSALKPLGGWDERKWATKKTLVGWVI